MHFGFTRTLFVRLVFFICFIEKNLKLNVMRVQFIAHAGRWSQTQINLWSHAVTARGQRVVIPALIQDGV